MTRRGIQEFTPMTSDQGIVATDRPNNTDGTSLVLSISRARDDLRPVFAVDVATTAFLIGGRP